MLGTFSGSSGSCEVLKSLRRALVAGVALTVMAGVASPAEAAASRKKVRHIASKSTKREAPKYPFGEPLKGQLQLVVSIANQHVTLYNDGVKVAQAPVSTGVPGRPTPMGVFSVIEKDRYHHSNLYSNAPMPFMQRITWSGVAIHEGPLPGGPASHGCIRTTHDFASKLWQVTKLGVRIIVSRTEVVPQEFEHPLLFNPAQKPAATTPAAEFEFDGLRPSFTQLGGGYKAPKVKLAWAASVKSDAKPIEIQQLETPAANAPPAAAAPETTTTTATPAPAVAPAAPGEVDTTASTKAPETPVAEKPAAEKPVAETPAPAAAPATQATATPAAETPAASTATATDLPKPDFDPVALPRPSPVKKTADLVKRRGHVAVFVSRKEMKVYVRQGFVPLFDMPVEIADPKEPLGIHVFTAMALKDDSAKLRWNAITMPAPGPARATEHNSKRNKKSSRRSEPAPKHVAETKLPTAAQALDRITIPQEAIDRISEIITPGSSLVVSDQGLGRETGRYTDFIVETR